MQPNIDRAKKICLELLNKRHTKHATMKTPYWEETVLRPSPNAILSYEIYKNKLNPSEHETVKALNELVKEGKADCILKSGWIWYYAKT